MARASALQRILHPMTIDEFAADYFQRRPLRIRGKPGKFDFLFRESDFELRLGRAKQIKAVFGELRQATIDARDIRHMLDAGATICVNGIERAHPKLLDVTRQVRAELGYAGTVSFRAYLSPPTRGFDLHFDARVATTLQIAGTKRWWYSDEPAVAFPLNNSGRIANGSAGDHKVPRLGALRSVLLRPGDVLCLPAGVWHCAKGTTKSLALNMAFDHYRAGAFDSIVNALEKRLMREAAWREPLPVAVRHKGKRAPPAVASAMRERIDALTRELAAMRDDEAALSRAWQRMLDSE